MKRKGRYRKCRGGGGQTENAVRLVDAPLVGLVMQSQGQLRYEEQRRNRQAVTGQAASA